MSFKNAVKSNPAVKAFLYKLVVNNARPRFWVRLLVTPFMSKRGRRSCIRRSSRIDIFPFNQFALGAGSTIEDFCTVNNGVGDVVIGDNSRIGLGSVLIGPVTIGNQVILAQNIVVSGLNHTYADVEIPIRLQKVTTKPIVVEDEAWIGANSVITAGVTIGKHSVVAAGAVVTKNIPPYSIAAGNPARVIKQFDFETKVWQKC